MLSAALNVLYSFNQLSKGGAVTLPIYREEVEAWGGLRNLPKVTQPESGKAGLQSQAVWLQSSRFYMATHLEGLL